MQMLVVTSATKIRKIVVVFYKSTTSKVGKCGGLAELN